MLETTPSHSLDTSSAHLRRGSAPGSGPDALPDLLLIERARGGDERAIEALIRRYGRRLFRVARSVLTDEERAETAVLEAYLAAFGDLSRYEPTGKFAAWLTRLAFNQARALRVSARAAQASALPAAGLPAAQAEPAAGDEPRERQALEQAIASLPPVFRTVYVLRVVEGISGIETAASLGVHETTVRTRLYRAHRRLAPDLAQRVRTAASLLEPSREATERIVSRTLAQLSHGSMLTISASPP
ncbi:MAG TPA: sigma-70 family RNA polymerase sigma factor [Steroidobacteraceae bacterium]|nr:sigma-70 family RNA polymerase sigma factor [Steroidobacteraceae bacterium]